MRLPLLEACSARQAHTEEKYPVPVLHVDHDNNAKKAQLNNLFKKDELPGMLEKTTYYTADMVSRFDAAITDRSLGFVQ